MYAPVRRPTSGRVYGTHLGTLARRDRRSGSCFWQDRPNHHLPQQQQQQRPCQGLLHHFSIASCGSRWYHTAEHLACLLSSKRSAHKDCAANLCIPSNGAFHRETKSSCSQQQDHSSPWRNNSCARIIPTCIGMFWGPTQPTRRCAHACVRAFDRKAGGFRRVSHPISPRFRRFQKNCLAALLVHTSFS